MKSVKRIVKILLALALVVGVFAGNGMEARATALSDSQNLTDTVSDSDFTYTESYSVYDGETWYSETHTVKNAKVGDVIELDDKYYSEYQIKSIEIDPNAFDNNGQITIKDVNAQNAYICHIYEPIPAPTEPVKVEVTYYYIDGNGNNNIYVDTKTVEGGTKWGQFFESYVPCYEDGKISNANSGNSWKTAVQNTTYTNLEDCYNYLVRNFNEYCDAAFVTYYGMPCDYKHAYFAFELLQNGEHVDSGTGWDFLIPSAYVYGSEEAIAYAKNALGMHDYIMDYCNTPGVEWTITAPYTPGEGKWDGYVVTIELPEDASVDNSDDNGVSNEPSVKEEPQTPENNYSVFQESAKADVDIAIAQATKAAQEAIANGTKAPATPIAIDTGVWISFKGDVYQKMQDSGLPVQITFRYKGVRYRVDIPAGADLMSLVDENGYCGFLNLMAHFGGTVL